MARPRARAGGVPARPDPPHASAPPPADHTRIPSDDDRPGLDGTPTHTHAPPARHSIHIAGPRARRKRQRLRPNGSIESDPAVDLCARPLHPCAGSLPIESYRVAGLDPPPLSGPARILAGVEGH